MERCLAAITHLNVCCAGICLKQNDANSQSAVPHYAVLPAVGGVGLFGSCPQFSASFSCRGAHNLNLTLLWPVFCSLTSFPHGRSAVELRFCTSLHWLSSLRTWTVLLSISLFTFYRFLRLATPSFELESNWNLMANGDAREGKWRGNWQIEWISSTLHTTSEHGVSSITTADAHTSAASSRLNWRPRRFKWTRPFRRKTKSGFCACAITFQLASTPNLFSWKKARHL